MEMDVFLLPICLKSLDESVKPWRGFVFFFRFRQVSLPRPVLGALCGAIGEDLPLMSEEVRR